MISTFLVNNSAAVPIAFWLAVLVSAIVGWALTRFAWRLALVLVSGAALLGVLLLTMSPSSGEPEAFCAVQFSIPFQGIDTLANLAMMLPLALFGALATRRPVAVFAAASGLSALIELVQALVAALGRACDTDDWFMNSIGAALGAIIAAGVLVLDAGRRTRAAASVRS
jgi:hypothetical protein